MKKKKKKSLPGVGLNTPVLPYNELCKKYLVKNAKMYLTKYWIIILVLHLNIYIWVISTKGTCFQTVPNLSTFWDFVSYENHTPSCMLGTRIYRKWKGWRKSARSGKCHNRKMGRFDIPVANNTHSFLVIP